MVLFRCSTLLTLLCAASLALGLLAGFGCLDGLAAPKKPALPDTLNWGDSGEADSADEAVKATRVSVSNDTLDDLKTRLRAFKYVQPLESSAFEYGFNGDFMKKLVSYWLSQYDWRVWEARLNNFDHFQTRIEGLNVHFIRVKPTAKNAKKRLPLLMLHGWPGSVFEFYKVLPMLAAADDEGVAFEVIAPSIPGYGWSEAPKKRGFSVSACARVFNKLMLRLGFQKYYIQGGDFGSVIGHVMSREFPDRVLGFHTNMPVQPTSQPSILLQTLLGAFLPAGVLFNRRDCEKLYPYVEKLGATLRETGHMHLQSTRPDSVAHALSDSPVGLAAYIVEKFSVWTLPENRFAADGNLVGPKAAFTLEEFLTNVMIYWTTGSIASSMRLYKETFGNDFESASAYQSMPSDVPHGVTGFAHELSRVPERFVRVTNPNLLHYTDLDRGGHFAALELPAALNSEVRTFVRAAEAFHRGGSGQLRGGL